VPGIEPGTSGFIARNSDHWTTEAVEVLENLMGKRTLDISWCKKVNNLNW
jgi:hypothetical protein